MPTGATEAAAPAADPAAASRAQQTASRLSTQFGSALTRQLPPPKVPAVAPAAASAPAPTPEPAAPEWAVDTAPARPAAAPAPPPRQPDRPPASRPDPARPPRDEPRKRAREGDDDERGGGRRVVAPRDERGGGRGGRGGGDRGGGRDGSGVFARLGDRPAARPAAAPVASARPGWSALARDDRLAGAIFGATHATFDECIERSLFGLPMQHRPMVEQVARERQHTVLFLFNYSSRMLHGVFGVAGEAGFPLERHAWVAGAWSHDTQSEVRGRWPATRFSAQVRILRFKVSPPPVHMDKLAHVLDVKNGRINKIHQVLSREQTAELLRIFERETDARARGIGTDPRIRNEFCVKKRRGRLHSPNTQRRNTARRRLRRPWPCRSSWRGRRSTARS